MTNEFLIVRAVQFFLSECELDFRPRQPAALSTTETFFIKTIRLSDKQPGLHATPYCVVMAGFRIKLSLEIGNNSSDTDMFICQA